MIGTLGGRAAEEIVFGKMEITNGASNDFLQVNSIARQMVTRFGMSRLTPMALEFPRPQVMYGRPIPTVLPDPFRGMAEKIDVQVIEIIEDAFEKACIIIERNRLLVDQLTTLLTQRETINGKAFEKFVNNYTALPSKTKITPLHSYNKQ